MTAVGLGLALGQHRLKWRFTLVLLATTSVATAAAAALERSAHGSNSAFYALSGAVFGAVLPVAICAVCARVVGRAKLTDAVWDVARHGWSRRQLLAGMWLPVLLVATLLGVWLPNLACLWFDETAGSRWTISWIGVLSALGYTSWFGLGASVAGSRGALAVLVLDWLLGSSNSILGVLWPRAHVQNLLGATPALDMTQPQASAALWMLIAASTAAILLRTPR